jgi:dTMP kinase
VAGRFITFEGGDGSGKSTQLRSLIDWLTAEAHSVVESREPGGTELGLELRELILHRRGHVAPRAEALLYAADRAHNVATKVRPAIEAGSIVVQDRYIDSSIAYQGAGRVLDPDEVRSVSAWATEDLKPDLTILLDLDPVIGRARIAGGAYDRLEEEHHDFHARVRDAYLGLAAAEPERFLVLDATRSIGELEGEIRARVSALLA